MEKLLEKIYLFVENSDLFDAIRQKKRIRNKISIIASYVIINLMILLKWEVDNKDYYFDKIDMMLNEIYCLSYNRNGFKRIISKREYYGWIFNALFTTEWEMQSSLLLPFDIMENEYKGKRVIRDYDEIDTIIRIIIDDVCNDLVNGKFNSIREYYEF